MHLLGYKHLQSMHPKVGERITIGRNTGLQKLPEPKYMSFHFSFYKSFKGNDRNRATLYPGAGIWWEGSQAQRPLRLEEAGCRQAPLQTGK